MVFEVEINEGTMRMNCLGSIFGFTVEDSDVVMARTIDSLITNRKVVEIILAETREYQYDVSQTELLKEIGDAITEIVKEKRLISIKNVGQKPCDEYIPKWYSWIQDLASMQLRGDPIGAYLTLTREIRHLKTKIMNSDTEFGNCAEFFLENCLIPIQNILENCKLIQIAKPSLTGYHVGDRTIYRKIFRPTTRPNFMYTKFMSQRPVGETIERYKVGDNEVEIFKLPGKIRHVYHIVPPEFRLHEDEYVLLDGARRILEERRPKELEITEQEKMRELFYTLSNDLLRDLSDQMSISVNDSQIKRLSSVLTRYTAGLGIIELLLADDRIQDIYINSPLGNLPIFVFHQDFEECETNLVPTKSDADRWATRFKLLSGRPLDEANPVLDTEVYVPGGIARVAAINPKLSPDGLGFALRRHRYKPWTFPLFMNQKYFDPLFGGLMWFMASYGRTFLVAGTRSSGKSSLLASMMLQILPYYRMITVEDTLELPVEAMRTLGFNIQRMKSRSVITKIETELPAEEALRTALRLGDSCLFIGEVRSTEAKALYEAMRIGALANTVAGTIHGESAYGVFDRVVNDLGVPPTSFKATDMVVVCNRLKSPDGVHTFRRVTELTEVRKHWKKDPQEEGGFVNLMEYSSSEDRLKPTDTLLNGESYILNELARRVPGWSGRWNLVWENIQLRANILQKIVEIANKTNQPELLEAENIVQSNQMFHGLCDKSVEENGAIDSKRVLEEWNEWMKKQVR
ncbi:MAG: type II/IV secretion system ATPase subunit [Candidatus Aenigmarchaeota archaeon]|nr:type II/IV secretion system ATPase subunit [Candidatus Aenigmarchaeota archaeon]